MLLSYIILHIKSLLTNLIQNQIFGTDFFFFFSGFKKLMTSLVQISVAKNVCQFYLPGVEITW